jgi:uncharacterized pyridoxamine 5'-phosphate oxidase family protein
MASWQEFANAQPEMAALGRELLEKHHLAYIATVRSDGAPRLHPVSPLLVDGRLLICTPKSSPKGYDQLRDGRCVIHLLPGKNDDEVHIRAHARLVQDRNIWAAAQAVAHYVHDDDFLFEYDIESVMTAYWENVGQPGTYPVRRFWRAP